MIYDGHLNGSMIDAIKGSVVTFGYFGLEKNQITESIMCFTEKNGTHDYEGMTVGKHLFMDAGVVYFLGSPVDVVSLYDITKERTVYVKQSDFKRENFRIHHPLLDLTRL